MPHRLLTAASAVSLVLCAAVCAVWVRAQQSGGYVEHMNVDVAAMRDRQVMVWVGTRSLVLHAAATQWVGGYRDVLDSYLLSGRTGTHWQPLPAHDWPVIAARPAVWNRLGFHFRFGTDAGPQLRRPWVTLALPYWLLALLSALPPAWWGRQVRARRGRRRAGLCPRCGYDVRASAGRCPECGGPIAAEASRPAEIPPSD